MIDTKIKIDSIDPNVMAAYVEMRENLDPLAESVLCLADVYRQFSFIETGAEITLDPRTIGVHGDGIHKSVIAILEMLDDWIPLIEVKGRLGQMAQE